MKDLEKTNYLFSNRDLRKLILPLVLEQALAITVGMADTMMISSVGEVAVSGVSLVDMINMLFFSMMLTILTVVFRRELLGLFFGNIEADVMTAAIIYLVISAVSYPFLGIYNACAALLRSMGKTDITFKVSVIGNIINVAGNAICIFIFHMGVAGVAIPSLVSRVVMGVVLYVLLKKPTYAIYFDKERFRLDMGIVKKILYIGIPCAPSESALV